MNRSELRELIEDYLAGRVTDARLDELEALLEASPDSMDLLREQAEMDALLSTTWKERSDAWSEDLLDSLYTEEEKTARKEQILRTVQPQSPRLLRWVGAAAAALLITVGVFFLLPGEAPSPDSPMPGQVVSVDTGHGVRILQSLSDRPDESLLLTGGLTLESLNVLAVQLEADGTVRSADAYGIVGQATMAHSMTMAPDGDALVMGTNGDPDDDTTEEFFLARIGQDRRLKWARTIRGAGRDIFSDALFLEDGSFLVTGITRRAVDPATPTIVSGEPTFPSDGYNQTVIMRFTGDGVLQWSRWFDGSDPLFPYYNHNARPVLARMENGDILLGSSMDRGLGRCGGWLIRFTADGELLGQHAVISSEILSIHTLLPVGSDVIGIAYEGTAENRYHFIRVIRMDEQGEVVWTRRLEHRSQQIMVYSGRIDARRPNEIVLCGVISPDNDEANFQGLMVRLSTDGELLPSYQSARLNTIRGAAFREHGVWLAGVIKGPAPGMGRAGVVYVPTEQVRPPVVDPWDVTNLPVRVQSVDVMMHTAGLEAEDLTHAFSRTVVETDRTPTGE
jgi:hypothetical protein